MVDQRTESPEKAKLIIQLEYPMKNTDPTSPIQKRAKKSREQLSIGQIVQQQKKMQSAKGDMTTPLKNFKDHVLGKASDKKSIEQVIRSLKHKQSPDKDYSQGNLMRYDSSPYNGLRDQKTGKQNT